MDDMPTINDIMGYHEQAYVQSGLDRLTRDSLQYGSNPVEGVYRQAVTPIRSCPVDADSDNDGVIDYYDAADLDGNDRTIDSNFDEKETIKFSLTHLETFDVSVFGIVTEDIDVYSYPLGNINDSILLKKGDEVNIISVWITVDDKYQYYTEKCQYWFKIRINNKYVYSKWDDVMCDFTTNQIDLVKKIELQESVDLEKEYFRTGWYIPNSLITGVDFPIRIMSQTYMTCAATCLAMAYNYFIDSGRITGVEYFTDSTDSRVWNIEAKWYYPEEYKQEFVHGGDDVHLYATLSPNQIKHYSKLKDTISNMSDDIDVNLLEALKNNLDKHLPVLVSCYGDCGYNHFVLVVGYMRKGNNIEDFIAIEPLTYRIDSENGDDTMRNAHGAVCKLSNYFSNNGFNQKYISNTDNVTGIKYIEFDFQKKVE